MLAVGCGFAVVIGAGFMLHHQKVPDGLAQAFWPALAMLIAIVAWVAIKRPFAWGWGRSPIKGFFVSRRLRRKAAEEATVWRAQRQARLAKLAADPERQAYGALIEAGDEWSDEQIAYDLNPEWLMTCPHLQPVERAMRQAGLSVRMMSGPQVRAACRVDEAALRARFKLPKFVAYAEFYIPDRAEQDNPTALVGCNLCHATIHTVHPDHATPDVPWFPPRPEADVEADLVR